MKVNVLLFAQARQIAGEDSIEVELESGNTVAELKASLAAARPGLENLLSRSNIALDQKYAVDSDVVSEGSEVAMIPPVSGG